MITETAPALLEPFLDLLEPITRDRYDYPNGHQVKTTVNTNGVDIHVGDVQDVAYDGPVVHPYAMVIPTPGASRHTRLTGGPSLHRAAWRVTVAGGDLDRCLWALTRVTGALDGHRVTATTGRLYQTFDPGNIVVDRDTTPHRWYVPLEYATTAH